MIARIPVGVIVERHKSSSPWIDFTWRPASVLPGQPDTAPWTLLTQHGDTTTFYAGAAEIELHQTETTNYRDNLVGDSSLWVILRPADGEPPCAVVKVTADPAEGEGYTESGTDIVESVPMPDSVRELLLAFIAQYHVEDEPFIKRKRKRGDPEALARRAATQAPESDSER